MTREDITRMAREAELDEQGNLLPLSQVFERLVQAAYAAGAAAEREACAKVAEETVCDKHLPTGVKIYGSRAAAAIRARGNA